MTWQTEFGNAIENYLFARGAYLAIEQEGAVPTIESLQRLFDFFAVDEYSAYDFVPHCKSYLTNCDFIEDLPAVAAVLSEVQHLSGSESVIPEEMQRRLSPPVAEAFVAALIYAACALKEQDSADEWLIATAPLASGQPATDLLTASTVLRLDSHTCAIVETRVQKKWPLLAEPDYLYASYTVSDHFEDPGVATRVAWCRQKMKSSATPGIDGCTFRFGTHFVDSLRDSRMRRRANFAGDIERVYATIVDVLQGLAFGSDKHHALRDPVWSHSAPVRKRPRPLPDGGVGYDVAARVVVMGGSTPLRLHYWRGADGAYEFSNVTTDHDDPTIY